MSVQSPNAPNDRLIERIQREAAFVQPLLGEIRRVIVGQDVLVNRLLVALLCDGHVLIEGLPGLAKTLAVRTVGAALNLSFQRIQFTPDLLPSDVTGTQIYNPVNGEFTPRYGPVFHHLVLADEINRAPAKVQSALLEAMEERQVTIGGETRALPDPFMVLATQNPLEQEGTYPLPEAQLDRFMLKVIVDYPARQEERAILDRMAGDRPTSPQPIVDGQTVQRAQQVVNAVYMDDRLKEYILDIVFATRDPEAAGLKNLASYLQVGASPRATLSLVRGARALAFLNGKGYVSPEDIRQIAPDILRHRLILTFEAEAENVTVEQIVSQILSRLPVP
jgi:MoxR-like ATPase